MQPEEAEQALAAVAQARRRLAYQTRWSWPRHALVGLQMSALVASPAFGLIGMLAGLALVLVTTFLIIWHDRRRDGFFINGYKSGPSRRVALAIAGGGVLLLVFGALLRDQLGWWPAPLACGLIALVLGTLGSKWWEQVYRRDLDQPA